MAPPVCLRQISGMHLLVKLGHEVIVLIGSDKNAIADHTLSFISYSSKSESSYMRPSIGWVSSNFYFRDLIEFNKPNFFIILVKACCNLFSGSFASFANSSSTLNYLKLCKSIPVNKAKRVRWPKSITTMKYMVGTISLWPGMDP